MKPTNKEELGEYCLRRLGKGAHKVEVTEDQIDDCIDYALQMFRDYHYDGSERVYFKHQITEEDRNNKYITVPENIFGAIRMFPISSSFSANDGLFNIQYQMVLNDMYSLTGTSLVPYTMLRQRLDLLEEILVGEIPIRFNRHKNRLYIDGDWSRLNTGRYVVFECYEVVDPAEFPNLWNDRWLQNYTTALLKRQWGENLKKYDGMALVGGVRFNGQTIFNEGAEDILRLEADMINGYSAPLQDFIG